jgi:hypothetical protein
MFFYKNWLIFRLEVPEHDLMLVLKCFGHITVNVLALGEEADFEH